MYEKEYIGPLYLELSGFSHYFIIAHALAHFSMSVLFYEERVGVGIAYVVLYEEVGSLFAYVDCFSSMILRCFTFCRFLETGLEQNGSCAH